MTATSKTSSRRSMALQVKILTIHHDSCLEKIIRKGFERKELDFYFLFFLTISLHSITHYLIFFTLTSTFISNLFSLSLTVL